MTVIIKNKIGAHLSIKGSLLNIFKEADDLNIKTIACFTGSNLRYNIDCDVDENMAAIFKKKMQDGEYQVFSHASYLINIANKEKKENYNKSVLTLRAELQRCHKLGITGVAFHPGSYEKKTEGLMSIAETINMILQEYTGNTHLYIESSAGQGNTLPASLEDIKTIINLIERPFKQKVGLVIDTCHLFAAGYDLASKQKIDDFLLKYDTLIGLKYVKLIHLNDSKKSLGSRLDRHETIGKGCIGLENILYFIMHPLIQKLPKILETPVDNYLEWKKELFDLTNLLA
jgi:deoxyribonuclease-4